MAPTLKDCSIALSGTFGAGLTHEHLKGCISNCAGQWSAKVGDATTHLVASAKDWEGKSAKVQQAEKLDDIKIVEIGWLNESFKAKKKVDEKPYLMATTSTPKVEAKKSSADEQGNGKASKDLNKGKASQKKRGRSLEIKDESDDETEQPPLKKVKDGQMISKNINIPVDEGCQIYTQQRVYVDPEGIVYDASLNQTNAGNNNNKFYRIQVIDSGTNSFTTWTRWGRVGERGQSATLGSGDLESAIAGFEKKFKDKSGHKWTDRLAEPKKGKYTFIEKDYEPDSEDDEVPDAKSRRNSKSTSKSETPAQKQAECTLAVPVQELMQLIFNQSFFAATMADLSYDANKLPLGKLSKRTITRGFHALKDLAELLVDASLAQSKHGSSFLDAVADLSNRYYTVIPHSFGRNRPPVIQNDNLLKKEIELLDSLSEMSVADQIMKETGDKDAVHPLDSQYASLKLTEMDVLDHQSSEYKQLEEYLLKTHGSTHYMKFKVQEIFRIARDGEHDRFEASSYGQLPEKSTDKRLLWHGSRATNFGGILSQGLRIAPPEAPVSGYMFGKGIYLADISSKSANYCAYYTSDNTGLLLLCEAELGKPMLELTGADPNAGETAKKQGSWSTWGKGMTVPHGWEDAGVIHENLKGVMMPDTTKAPKQSDMPAYSLQYNEYICYDVAQICLRYLFRVEMT